ncbi:glycosyltransferase family 4 protein [Desulfovibrio sp. OttesenSCG-928-C14]|nr:glycosyltransferase family 4 protein [Desulfovibrio sp. OttesenSCG-928-C14]
MNILLMNLSREFGEAEKQTLFLALGLHQRSDCRVTLVCSRLSLLHEAAHHYALDTMPLTEGFFGKLGTWMRIRKFFKEHPGKWVLHANDDQSAILGAKIIKGKPPSVYFLNSRHLPTPLKDPRIETAFKLGLAVACPSQEIAYVMAEGKVPPRTLKIVPGGVDPELYPARVERKDTRLVFVSPGRLVPEKGHWQILEAMKLLLEDPDMPPWEVRFCAPGPLADQLYNKACEIGVESRLSILGGQPDFHILPWCDVLLAPALQQEGPGMEIMQGWATGLPVICSDTMAYREIVKDGENGLFFKAEMPASLAEKMMDVGKSDALRRKLVEGGTESLQKHTHKSLAARYLYLYHHL